MMGNKRIFTLRVALSYNYGGDTGRCTIINEFDGPFDYDELIRKIDALGAEVREQVKLWAPEK